MVGRQTPRFTKDESPAIGAVYEYNQLGRKDMRLEPTSVVRHQQPQLLGHLRPMVRYSVDVFQALMYHYFVSSSDN